MFDPSGLASPSLWLWFLLGVGVMLALDLGVFHRRSHVVSMREALTWSGVWIALSLAFGGVIAWRFGAGPGLDFLTAYLVEKSLSADNLFAFVVVFAAFGVAERDQHRVLFWGIFGALLLRAALIFGGVALLSRFGWLVIPLGLVLVASGVKLLVQRGEKAGGEGRVVGWLKARPGSKVLLALIAVELTDLVFAIDSVPATLAITHDAFLVFTSNVCAMLGLRSLYFALAGLMKRLTHLKAGLAAILIFVGAKMIVGHQLEVPHGVSLLVIVAILGVSVAASLWRSGARGGGVSRASRLQSSGGGAPVS